MHTLTLDFPLWADPIRVSLSKRPSCEIVLQVLQWMEEAGLQPSIAMYHDVLFFAQRSGGPDLAAMIQANMGSFFRSSIIYNAD